MESKERMRGLLRGYGRRDQGRVRQTPISSDTSRRDGGALLGDHRALVVSLVRLGSVAAVDVRPELHHAVRIGKGGEIDEMHRHRPAQLYVEPFAPLDLRLDPGEVPALLLAEQPGDEIEHLLDAHAA